MARPLSKPAIRGERWTEGLFEDRLKQELLVSEPCSLDRPSYSPEPMLYRIGGTKAGPQTKDTR